MNNKDWNAYINLYSVYGQSITKSFIEDKTNEKEQRGIFDVKSVTLCDIVKLKIEDVIEI